jgi:hypothetical protein
MGLHSRSSKADWCLPVSSTVVLRQSAIRLICVNGTQIDRIEPRAMAGGTDWIALVGYASLILAAAAIGLMIFAL